MSWLSFSKAWLFTGASGASSLLQSPAAFGRGMWALPVAMASWIGAVQGLSPMEETEAWQYVLNSCWVSRIWGFKSCTVGIQLGLTWVVLLSRGWWRCPCTHFPAIPSFFPGIRDFSDAIGSARLVDIRLYKLWKTSQSTSIIPQYIFEGRRGNSDTIKKNREEI